MTVRQNLRWMNWLRKLSVAASIVAAAAACMPATAQQTDSSGNALPADNGEATPPSSGFAIIPEALGVLRSNYIAPLDEDDLASQALKHLISSLDGHSTYLTKQEYADLDQKLTGEFGGIGVVLEVVDGKTKIIAPLDGGASAQLGVQPGWEVIRVDGVELSGRTLTEVTRLLRGRVGTSVSVTFVDLTRAERTVAIDRQIVRLDSVYARRIGNAGYVRISGFNRTTPEDLSRVLARFRDELPITGLLLDLRNNSGGFVDSAVAVAGHFMGPGQPVVRTGRDFGSATLTHTVEVDPVFSGIPMVVLVNGGTASASEILAGALQEQGRARLVGVTTYGKGLVQTIFPLSGGANGAVSVTTMRYYTPLGASIQQVGIVPDLAVARTWEEAQAAINNSSASEATLANALANEASVTREPLDQIEGPTNNPASQALFVSPTPTDAEIVHDHQLLRALDLLGIQRPEGAPPKEDRRIFGKDDVGLTK